MTVVAAFLVPGSPLPYLARDNPPWREIVAGYEAAAGAMAAARPDAILLYSTQWIAVLDELWQTRARVKGLHVDENWYEFGDLPYDITIDTELAQACVAGCASVEVRAKAVDYDGFPIDTGTIIANNFLNAEGKTPLVIAANNVYHDWDTTKRLSEMAAATAAEQDKRLAVVGVGGLSGTIFREEIAISEDRIASDTDDAWNRKILALMEEGDAVAVEAACAEYAGEAKVDMGFKHFAWILGALGGRYAAAKVHAYGPAYGSGAAVVEYTPSAG